MRHPKAAAKAKAPRQSKPSVRVDAVDGGLWEALRTVRLKLAQDQGLPAFTIFHDSTLQQIAVVRPRSEAQFRSISGVGNVKFQRYGQIFMDAIRDHEGKAA